MITIKQVSELSGVSKSTVSRVISGKGQVSKTAREKVTAAIEQLGYRPNQIAQSLKRQKSDMIGLLTVHLGSPFYAELMGGAQERLRMAGKDLIVASGYGTLEGEQAAIQMLCSRGCDGLICFIEGEHSLADLRMLSRQIPLVILNRHDLASHLTCLSIDNYHGSQVATQYLLDRGHRDIVYFSGPTHLPDAKQRLNGFIDTMYAYGIEVSDEQVVPGEYSPKSGYQRFSQLVSQRRQLPSAIYAGDDDIAAGIFHCARELGIDIPNELSVIGYDNSGFAGHMYPGLTTVTQPMRRLGEQAVDVLSALLTQQTPDSVTIRPQLFERDSVMANHG